jgi:hypothetical protein
VPLGKCPTPIPGDVLFSPQRAFGCGDLMMIS